MVEKATLIRSQLGVVESAWILQLESWVQIQCDMVIKTVDYRIGLPIFVLPLISCVIHFSFCASVSLSMEWG